MVEALKKIDRKVLIVLLLIIFLPLFIILFLICVRGCGNIKVTPEKYEEKMALAAENYVKDKKIEIDELSIIELKTLIDSDYIKSPKKLVGDDTCDGEVYVRNNDGKLSFSPTLVCDEHKTARLIDLVMTNLTKTGAGLYEQNGYYVFKGDEVNNYITFFGKKYRILNIDSNGVVKLLKEESEPLDYTWDMKYNQEVDDSYGKNIYKDSGILKQLLVDYNTPKIISDKSKTYIVASNVCIDSRHKTDGTIKNYNCENYFENQVISLMDVSDFANASLDEDCNSIFSKSCKNYNYLKYLNLKTWTVNSVTDNTYEVFYLSNGTVRWQEASKYQNYNIVIYIDGYKKINSGKGTKSNPFVIE